MKMAADVGRWSGLRSWLGVLGFAVQLLDCVVAAWPRFNDLPIGFWFAVIALTMVGPRLPNWRSKGGVAASAIYPALGLGLLGAMVVATR